MVTENSIEEVENEEEEEQAVFLHEDFKITINDKYNLRLSRIRDVAITDRTGMEGRRGKGKATGEFEKKFMSIGFYTSLSGAFLKLIDILAAESKDVQQLKQTLVDMKKIAETVGRASMTRIYELQYEKAAKNYKALKQTQESSLLKVKNRSYEEPVEVQGHVQEVSRGRGRPKKRK